MRKTRKSEAPPAPVQPAIYYSLHTLLETIRLIKVYEDPLCTLLHAIETTGNLSGEVEQELHSLLDEMPSAAYALELNDLRGKLAQVTAPVQSVQDKELQTITNSSGRVAKPGQGAKSARAAKPGSARRQTS